VVMPTSIPTFAKIAARRLESMAAERSTPLCRPVGAQGGAGSTGAHRVRADMAAKELVEAAGVFDAVLVCHPARVAESIAKDLQTWPSVGC